ncbi:hypothetical protein E2P81_ATG04628 [Venturia nashicola]|uniref:Uncharacterized protein n=1 Tax=Venturia nashicola TaxID=86259 RepID=A0A4Z1NYY9_9PEZI|nr:hypothetical protein E6O75_ATG04737 [Venturia nashicola]TLD34463.1 hypothetical protein E2P81_ATG04628 [Venturia nashicola]
MDDINCDAGVTGQRQDSDRTATGQRQDSDRTATGQRQDSDRTASDSDSDPSWSRASLNGSPDGGEATEESGWLELRFAGLELYQLQSQAWSRTSTGTSTSKPSRYTSAVYAVHL